MRGTLRTRAAKSTPGSTTLRRPARAIRGPSPRPPENRPVTAAPRQDESPGLDPLAGFLALVLPGLGHAFRGQVLRGVLIGAGILGLFAGGILIGGITVVDSRSDRTETRISFIGQAFVGPVAFAVNTVHQSSFKGLDPLTNTRRHALPDERIENGRIRPMSLGAADGDPPVHVSIGKMHEIGVLYCLVAGMLNFIAFLDALRPPAKSRDDDEPVRTTGVVAGMLSGQSAGGTA